MRTLEIGEKRRISNESPGEYEIVRMNLVGPPNPTRRGDFRNKAYSIELIFSNISIYEDLYSNCLSAKVSIVDSNSILSEFPLIGDEFIEILFRSINTEVGIHLKFRVVECSEIECLSDSVNTYTLLLSSPVSIRSEKQKISKSFAGINHKTHRIVQEICEKYLGLVNENNVKVKEIGDYLYKDKRIEQDYYSIESVSGHSEKYISPFQSPFTIINNLCRRSVNSKGALYFFFEDADGFRFMNMEENFINKKNKTPSRKLVYYPANAMRTTRNSQEVYWSVVESYTIKKRFDVFGNMAKGMYSSSVSFLDLEKKKVTSRNFYYQEEGAEFSHGSDGYLLTSKYSDLIHNTKLERPTTYTSLISVHSGDAESQDYSSHEKEYFQRRLSMEAQMNGIILEVQIPGDTSGQIKIGEFVDFSIYNVSNDGSDDIVDDQYLSGKYMISRIHHNIAKGSNRYSMIVELISATVFSEYDINPSKTEVDVKSISVQVDSKELDLEEDQVKVSTSSKAIHDVNMRQEIDRKRRLSSLNFPSVT